MIEPGNMSFGAFPAFEPLPAMPGPVPTNGQQATFETALLLPPEELQLGSPPSNLLPFPFDETKSMGDRIIDAFERMRQSVGLPPPAAEVPDVDPAPQEPPVGEAPPASETPPAVVESVVVENGVPLTSERPDGRIMTITVNGADNAVVETLEDGTTVVRTANGGTTSVSADFTPSVSFIVADGDRILASLAQMRAEVL